MHGLIEIFAGRTCQNVRFIALRSICILLFNTFMFLSKLNFTFTLNYHLNYNDRQNHKTEKKHKRWLVCLRNSQLNLYNRVANLVGKSCQLCLSSVHFVAA